jgi:hypothetical protein
MEETMLTLMTYRQIYVRTVLYLYLQLPDTSRPARQRDRALADCFFDRQIPIQLVETALLLGSARRLFRWPRPAPIRSLHYFEPIVEELLTGSPCSGLHMPASTETDSAEYDPEPPF